MEISVALCEEDGEDLEIIEKYIYSMKETIKINSVSFFNKKDLYSYIERKNIDICFINVNFSNGDGINIAKNIKKVNEKCIIVFLAQNDKYAMDAFKVRAFDYLLKPVSLQVIDTLWKDITQRINEIIMLKKHNMEIAISNKEKIFKVKYEQILYFEKKLRKIMVVCDDNIIEYYGSFKDLYERLDKTCFTQCHQSFIVNNDKIREYGNQVLSLYGCSNGIPVSKSCIKEVREKISQIGYK